MLKHSCSQTIDEPVRILGLETEDWGIMMLVWIPGELLAPAYVALAIAIAAALVIRVAKRGQPNGALIHAWWALAFRLPGWPPSPPAEGRRYSPWA